VVSAGQVNWEEGFVDQRVEQQVGFSQFLVVGAQHLFAKSRVLQRLVGGLADDPRHVEHQRCAMMRHLDGGFFFIC